MKVFHSIRWRLQFWYALLLASVLAAFSISAYEIARADLVRSADADLERRAGALSRAIRNPPPPAGAPRRILEGLPGDSAAARPPPRDDLEPPLRPPGPEGDGQINAASLPDRLGFRLTPQEEADYGSGNAARWYYVIWLRNGAQVIRSPAAPADVSRPARIRPRFPAPVLRSRGDTHEAFLTIGPGEVVLVGHSLTADLLHLHHIAWLVTSAAVLILGLGLLGGHWLVGRSLRPIEEISSAAAKIAAGNLGERIGARDTASELGELAQVLDTTFARLEGSFAQQARFTADAAHELRTPLAVLLTHTQNALAVPCGSDEHQEAFAACQRAAQRMRALIESLLWLARLDSGDQTLKKVRFNLADRVADCVALLRPLAEKSAITVRTNLAPAECTGDPGQIDQVIINLLTNAIDHNFEKGEVRVATLAGLNGATLAVADNGPGIASDHLPHIFDRFYRADESRSRSSGGAGLGLAIAKAIVEAHGGSLRAESEPGHGAIFTASFPN